MLNGEGNDDQTQRVGGRDERIGRRWRPSANQKGRIWGVAISKQRIWEMPQGYSPGEAISERTGREVRTDQEKLASIDQSGAGDLGEAISQRRLWKMPAGYSAGEAIREATSKQAGREARADREKLASVDQSEAGNLGEAISQRRVWKIPQGYSPGEAISKRTGREVQTDREKLASIDQSGAGDLGQAISQRRVWMIPAGYSAAGR
ncbi:hypothetical protein BJ322DRAFT_1024143 [Thelephora terrestris]|uniref:Uncharacterized protein n=1 Tax=Thelephora terrestris TaxID=56493 RepID=A0A9P6L2C2_9AGAM|nr:hypothetical protein BJ322DRAFT_1024143 [Thelephora terrestris]